MREIPKEQEIAETYRRCSSDEIAELAAQKEALTDAGRAALDDEIARRGLSANELKNLHQREVRREAEFDKLEGMRRKKTALYLLTRGDAKGTIVILGAAAVVIIGLWLLRIAR
jgi:hypothetical protein